jgi:hypothetical protein
VNGYGPNIEAAPPTAYLAPGFSGIGALEQAYSDRSCIEKIRI